MDVIKFFEEYKRMCHACGCLKCPLSKISHNYLVRDMTCECAIVQDYRACVPIVEKWSKENPRKTRLMDFKEKHPKAPLNDGYPHACCSNLGYCDDCIGLGYKCHECWDTEME